MTNSLYNRMMNPAPGTIVRSASLINEFNAVAAGFLKVETDLAIFPSATAVTFGSVDTPAIGANAPGTGKFTTLETTGDVGVGTAAPTGTNSGGYACKATFYANANAAINIKDVNGDWSLGTTAGSLVFYSQTASKERGRFDDSGRLLLGVTSGIRGLTVAASTDAYTGAAIVSRSFNGAPGGASLYFGNLNNDAKGAINYDTQAEFMSFLISSTERMRIDSSGILIVGTTTALSGGISGLHTNGTAGSGITLGQGGTARGFVFASQATTRVQVESVSGWPIACVAGGTNGVSLASGGTSWGALSDEREKTIIEPITDPAAKVSTLRAVIGRYNSDDEATRRAFLIAQDVNAVLPEAVNEQDERLILQYTDTIPLLVAAIKELTTRITALEGK